VLEVRLDMRRALISEQVIVASRGLAAQVRAGEPLTRALTSVALTIPAPFGEVLTRTADECRRGASLKQALADLKERVRIEGVSVLCIALTIADERGGSLGLVLDRITHSLEENQRVERKRQSDTAGGRLVVWILTVFPAAFLGMFAFLDPEGTKLLFSLIQGQITLGVVALITYASWRWSQSILSEVE
jgi:tight adherence protein B